jgi:TRAP transporter TAXI family solute receptor
MAENGVKRRRMLQNLRAQAMIVGPVLILVIAGFMFAYRFVGPAPPDRVTMATGSSTGAYQAFGKIYAERFRKEGIELALKSTGGSKDNLSLIGDPAKNVPIAFIQGGVSTRELHPDLMSLGSVYFEPRWVFVRSTGGDAPQRLTGLAGKRIAVGGVGSGTRTVARKLLAENGIDSRTATLVDLGGPAAAAALKQGKIDAAFFITSATSNTVRDLISAPGIRLTSFERAEAYLRRHRYLSRVMLPKGSIDLARNLPQQDVVLLAPTATVVVNGDLHPALVDLLLLTMQDAHRAGGLLEPPGDFPTAKYVTFPLEPAARRFFERGAPFLQRYLPFWAANLIDRLKIMLLPLLTLLYPLFKILPPMYNWRMRARVDRWYKDLQALDDSVRSGAISNTDAKAEIDRIELAVEHVTVPPSFAASAYTLRLHIDFLRQRIDAEDGETVG